MSKRSLKASVQGQARAKQALLYKGWTQDYLATEAGLSTRNSVWKFLSGRPVDRHIFIELCFRLDLDWQETAELPLPPTPPVASTQQEAVAAKLKARMWHWVEKNCGTLQSYFDSRQSLSLSQSYVGLRIVEQSGLVTKSWLEWLAQHPQTVILGQPGTGKTTFLKYLALQCYQEVTDWMPIFVSLRNVLNHQRQGEELTLFNYLVGLLKKVAITTADLEYILAENKLLILLDGLDEVPKNQADTIIALICNFAETHHSNPLIITCRLGAQPYHFQGFTYRELARFNPAQISEFAQKWFTATLEDCQSGLARAGDFLEVLQRPENKSIQELAQTPILLALICSVFQARCQFPHKRSHLYQEALEVLLKNWDQVRGIKRLASCPPLSLLEQLKLLSSLAAIALIKGGYTLEREEILPLIMGFLSRLPGAETDADALWLNSETLLQDMTSHQGIIEEQAKGIYGFSHITFQEYLTARKILADTVSSEPYLSLAQLAQKLLMPQWQEVILLTVEMLPEPLVLLQLLRQEAENILQGDRRLQEFLETLVAKAQNLQVPYLPVAVRAFYLGLECGRDLNLASALDNRLGGDLAPAMALDLNLVRILNSALALGPNPSLNHILELSFALEIDPRLPLEVDLRRSLWQLQQLLPPLTLGLDAWQRAWQNQGAQWCLALRQLLEKNFQIGQEWQWSPQQKEALRQYYEAHLFLVNCLRVSPPASREAIAAQLLTALA